MTAKLHVAVHRDMSMAGPVLDGATRLFAPSPSWTLAAGPATHAFIWIEAGGLCWRQDGAPGGARWSGCVPGEWLHPTASWSVLAEPKNIDQAISLARKDYRQGGIDGIPYDWGEVVAQAIPGLGRLELSPARLICTTCVLRTLGAAEIPGLLDLIPGRYPEQLARAFDKHPFFARDPS